MSAKPSSNAVKHGLSSLHHLPRGREDELPPIEQELIQSRQPDTPEQREIVKDLAFALWQKGEHDRLWLEQAAPKYINSEELFAKQTAAAYKALHEQWLASPQDHQEAMTQTLEGVKLFLRTWQIFQQSLADGSPGPSLKMTREAIRTLGISPSPHMIYGDGEWLLAHSMAMRTKPDKIVMEWMIVEKTVSSDDANDRAKALRERIANAGDARAKLRKRAAEEVAHWQKQVEIQTENHELARLEFIEANANRILIDPDHEAHLQRLHRYRVFTENRVKDFNRRLANLKAEQVRKKWKETDQEERRLARELQADRLKQAKNEHTARQMRHFNLPAPDPNDSAPMFYRVPSQWRDHRDILTMIKPNMENFMFWTYAQLQQAEELFQYLSTLPGLDPAWLWSLREYHRLELENREKHRIVYE